MSVADRLKTVRTDAGLSQKELADKLGMPLRTYGSYERGERDISTAILLNICKTLNVSSDYILGRAETNPEQPENLPHFDNLFPVKLKKIPLLGEIACGEPIFADEDKESFVMADMDIHADFCLRAKGDSMINARINDGDIVFIREMPMVDNGDIAAVVIDDEATLKRVYFDREKAILQLAAENPKYMPFVYRGEELNHIRILGKAVYFMSAL